MHDLQIESHVTLKNELPRILATHMITTYLDGGIAVVCDSPRKFMSQVKTEWDYLFTDVASHDGRPSFSAASLFDDVQANIVFATAKECKLLPPICETLYVVCRINRRDMYMITSWMKPYSKVIIYTET